MQTATDSDRAHDDEADGLPPLDGDNGEQAMLDEELGLSEEFFEEDGAAATDDLAVGLEEDTPDFSLAAGGEGEDLGDMDDAGDLIEGTFDMPDLGEDQQSWSADEADGIELAEMVVLSELPPIHEDEEEGLEDALAADAGDLPALPALDGQDGAGDEGVDDDEEFALLGIQAGTRVVTVEVAPGVSWPLMPFVQTREVERPEDGDTLPVCAALGGSVLVYLRRMYRLQDDVLLPFGGEGLLGTQVDLCSAPSDSHDLWALGSGRAQYSDDGGESFAAPVAIGEGQPMRAAMATDGSLLVACAGALYRCEPGVRIAAPVPVDGEVVDVAVDGLHVLIATADGRLLLSERLCEAFHPFARVPQPPQRMQLRDRSVLVSTAEGLLLYDGQDCREAFPAVSHAFELCFEPGGVAVYACARTGSAWLLVKIPVSGVVRKPIVVAQLPRHLGAPRSICLQRKAEGVLGLIGFESGFYSVQVFGEQD